MIHRLLVPLAALLLAVPLVPAQGRREEALREFEKRRLEFLVRSGQRHLVCGVDLRKSGLTTQAAEQILLAVEVSEGRNPGASTVLALMRDLDEKFWSKKAPKPTRAGIDAYSREGARLLRQDRKERLDLALWALAHGLGEEAHAEVRRLLLERDEPLQFDARDALLLEGGRVPAELARRIRGDAIEINGRLYVRDLFLSRLPGVKEIWEKSSEELRVRSTRGAEDAEALHTLGARLLPLLEADLGARPDRRLHLAAFSDRKTYDAYLESADLGSHKALAGFADNGAFVAIVCEEGLDETTLQGVALHELTHLYDFGCSRAVMPGWYAEGLAESYGGRGTFRWEEGNLEVGGNLERRRVEPLRAERLPLRELVSIDPLALWNKDREKGLRFYAESWAFLRYLRSGAGPEIAARLERFEAMCRGSAIGAEVGAPYKTDRSHAERLFERTIGTRLEDLEEGFAAWLERF
ncbi:MAG TPA: hypothetical protein VFI25_17855 [Planctomycetota bacterium]|nr:hypothetical protein [Planctomycetota bacterium]